MLINCLLSQHTLSSNIRGYQPVMRCYFRILVWFYNRIGFKPSGTWFVSSLNGFVVLVCSHGRSSAVGKLCTHTIDVMVYFGTYR